MVDVDQGQSIATNTLLVPDIPRSFFSSKAALDKMKTIFEQFGPIYAFIVMKGFGRFMIIYEGTANAMKAKESLDMSMLYWLERQVPDGEVSVEQVRVSKDSTVENSLNQKRLLRVYYGQHNPINQDPTHFQLKVPEAEKNFLISPPGSPCENWQQTRESPPNTAVLASDLTHAIADMSDDDIDDLENFSLESPVDAEQKQSNGNGKRVMLKIVGHDDGNDGNEHLPQITVQNWDSSSDQEDMETSRRRPRKPFPRATIVHTPRPPLSNK